MKLNISGKIILMAAAGVIASSLIILFISTNLMGGQITRILYNDMGTMRTVVERMQQQEEMRLVQEAQLLITMPQVVDAVYEADIERIREFAQMSWHRLGLDAITFTDTSGIALVRGHTDIKGDDLSSRPSMHAALSGELISGIFFEETAIIPYAIRCYAPIFRDGVLVGALTLGTEIGTETYVDNLYKISGMHFTLFKGDTILITSIRDKEGGRIRETRVKPEVSDAVLIKGEIVIVNCEILGEPGMTAYWPIKDIGGNTIGMWALTMSLTQRNNETNRVLMIVILCSLGIIFIIILAASILGSRISKPIRKVTDYAVQVADGNLDVTLDVQSKDEVGLLVGALRAMVITLKERIQKEEALNASALQELKEKKELLLSNESLIQEAQRQRIEAEAANKAKSTFLSTMSHEIRTPMNAILGITEIQLQYEALDPNIRDALEKIYTSGDMLLGIINDILDLSKIEAGKLELLNNKYEIASMISDTAQLNMMRIGSKQIEFEIDVDENIPAIVLGDELRVKQILNNLLSNAFKYTTEGTVGLSITSEASKNSDDEVVLVVSVSDTGQGMTEEQINKLFDEYARFNQEANRSAEGTGLGMGITRNLIRLMNGDIQVESKPGKGSTFTVRLTQGRSDSGVLGKEIAENLHQFRTYSRARMRRVQISREPMPYGSVLIVDDVETNIYVAKGLLAPYGLKTDSANSAFAAIEEIKRGKKYDIIFMDHMMPEMDGVEATNILRKMGYEQPIVALTANAVSGQAGLFLENGFNDFISKPIDIRQLNIVLNKLIRDKQSPEVIEAARQQAEAKRELADNMPAPDIEPYFNEIFVRDAAKTLSVLNTIIEKNGSYDENDLRMYIIHTHGIKSALANIGKTELSAVALKLEQSGRDKNIEIIKSETPAFLSLLQTFVEELKLKIDNTGSGTINEDKSYLNEKLLVIKAACEEYDENTANKVITELRGKTWSEPTREFLGRIDEHLLHSNFEEIVEIINN